MGTMFYLPNIQAAVYYATKVHPLISQKYPDAEFIVAGKEPTPEVMALSHISGVKITGTVPDMRKQLEECDVVVVPLLSGSGTRIKVLEAMASARPVVSTEKGCEGLDARHRENILISDGTPEDFANQVLSLFSSDELVRKLVEGGLAMAKANAWRHHAKRQLLVFEEIT